MFRLFLDNSKYPFNQLPVLEVNGTVLSNTIAILKYLAKEHGMFFKISYMFSYASIVSFQTHKALYVMDKIVRWVLSIIISDVCICV